MLAFRANTPRWVIIFMDLFICLGALLFAYLIRFDLKADKALISTEWAILSKYVWLFFVVRFAVFFAMGIHKGLVRYTSFEDLKRIFTAVTFSSLIFFAAGYLRLRWDDGYFLFPMSVLIIEWMTCFIAMTGIRFIVKLMYLESVKSSREEDEVLIYGAGISGQLTKRTIEKDVRIAYKLIGFIDDNLALSGNRIEGVKIFPTSKLEDLIKGNSIKRVIVAIQRPDEDRLKGIVELCLENGIEIQKVPNPKSWINGEFSARQMGKVNIEDLLGRKPIVLNEDNLHKELKQKTVLVTGAAGSIGSGLVRQIAHFEPRCIILLDQAESPLYDFQNELHREFPALTFEVVIGDIRSIHRMERLFSHFSPQYVFHAAAYKHVPLMENNPSEALLTNIKGTKNLVDLSLHFGVEKFVMVSTDKAVNPTNVMGASKRIAEMYAQAANLRGTSRFVTTRFGNVLGSNGSVIPLFQRQIEMGGPVTVTDERITRFFMTIPEACRLVLEAGTIGEGGEIFVFDMGESVKIVDLAKKMIQLSGLELGKDIEIVYTGLRPGEKLYEELLASEEETIPTHHPKILKAKIRTVEEQVLEQIDNLISLFDAQKNEEIVAQMKTIVPEFISNNSQFEKLDK